MPKRTVEMRKLVNYYRMLVREYSSCQWSYRNHVITLAAAKTGTGLIFLASSCIFLYFLFISFHFSYVQIILLALQ